MTVPAPTSDWETSQTDIRLSRSNHLRHRLQIDAKSFQEFRRHDVEADRELQFDQRARREFCGDGVEGRIGRLAQLDDLVGEGERRTLRVVEAGCGLPVCKR